jgi:glycosyltransferase involved in cell wall biosynthesis
MQPLVSVVIPSYNHAAFVGESVRSVLTQEVDALELIVVDDGSRDDSLALLRAIDDPRMRVIAQENRGAHLALDRGLREARGQYLGILNSDDRYAPGRLRAALAALRADPSLALVGSWVEVIDAEGRVLGVKQGYLNMDPWPSPEPARTFKADESLWTALLMQNYWATTSNYVMPRATYERHGPFRPLRYAHDWDFALRVQREQPALLLADPLLQYRIHGSNTIRDNRAAMIYEVCWILANHLPRYLGGPVSGLPGASDAPSSSWPRSASMAATACSGPC